jgi:NhaA family Na+:H+ antiporter
VLAGTLLAALLATVVLRLRDRRYRRIAEAETRDLNADGVPDVFQQPDGEAMPELAGKPSPPAGASPQDPGT